MVKHEGTQSVLWGANVLEQLAARRNARRGTHVVDLESRVAAAPRGGPATPVLIEPPTATEHPVCAIDLGVVDVPAPVPDIAEHVVEPPWVGAFAAHFVDALVRVTAVPADLVEIPVVRPGRPGPAGVFPLGFGRQSIPVGRRVPLDVFGLGTEVVRGREAGALGAAAVAGAWPGRMAAAASITVAVRVLIVVPMRRSTAPGSLGQWVMTSGPGHQAHGGRRRDGGAWRARGGGRLVGP